MLNEIFLFAQSDILYKSSFYLTLRGVFTLNPFDVLNLLPIDAFSFRGLYFIPVLLADIRMLVVDRDVA